MKPGDRIKIKDAEGRKHRGTVIDIRTERQVIGAPGEAIGGRTTTTLTIDLEPS